MHITENKDFVNFLEDAIGPANAMSAIAALERIRAYELGAPGSRVHRCAYRRAHLEEPNAHASVGKLERRFGSCKAGDRMVSSAA